MNSERFNVVTEWSLNNICWGTLPETNDGASASASGRTSIEYIRYIADPEEFKDATSISSATHIKFLSNTNETCYLTCDDNKEYLLHAHNINVFIDAIQELDCAKLREITFGCCRTRPEPSCIRYISNGVNFVDRITDAISVLLNASSISMLNYVDTSADSKLSLQKIIPKLSSVSTIETFYIGDNCSRSLNAFAPLLKNLTIQELSIGTDNANGSIISTGSELFLQDLILCTSLKLFTIRSDDYTADIIGLALSAPNLEYLSIRFDDVYCKTIDIKAILESIAAHPTLKGAFIDFASFESVEEQMLDFDVSDIECAFRNNYHILKVKIIPLAIKCEVELNKIIARNLST